MSDQPIRVSVLGAGMALHSLHWPSIVSQPRLFKLHSVLDRSGRGRVEEVCGEGVKVVGDLKGVVDDPEVEVVSCNTFLVLSCYKQGERGLRFLGRRG